MQQPPNYPPYQGPQQPMPPQQPYPGYPQPAPGQFMPPPSGPRKNNKNKVIIICIAVFIGIFIMNGIANQGKPTTSENKPTPTQKAQAKEKTPAPTAEPTKQPDPTPTPTPQVEHRDIVVTSLIVKKVGGKYRYFFDVRNHSDQPFEGSATIELYNEKQQTSLRFETFETNQPIEPGIGTDVYFDINTGPTNVHGEYGITKYKYVIEVGGNEVNRGEGPISDRYEDTGL